MGTEDTPSADEIRGIVGGDPDIDIFLTNFFEEAEANDRRTPLDVHRESLRSYVRPVDGTRWFIVGEKADRFLVQEQHSHRARLINETSAIICDHKNSDPARTVCGWSVGINHPFNYNAGAMVYWLPKGTPVGVSFTDGELAEIRAAQGYAYGGE